MNVFELYQDPSKHNELAELITLGAQKHPAGLAPNFLEKDIWVTEILRLLYDEQLLGKNLSVAFKGGTALSKCWKAIERFSEDIDLSIHWADLASVLDENAAWEKSTSSRSQRDKFRKEQTKRLTKWSAALVEHLNRRLAEYGIAGLRAELETDSQGEKIDIHFPSVVENNNAYQLDHILLEFGGRNRGRPTETHDLTCYLNEIPEFEGIIFPIAKVKAYDPAYILWEKITCLHQHATMDKEPNSRRLARHWYDIDCLLQKKFSDPLNTSQAMQDVVSMKKERWPEKGVNYEAVLQGHLQMIPSKARLQGIEKDHQDAINGAMFYKTPDDMSTIIERLSTTQNKINELLRSNATKS